ncbi:glycosyltransferase family 39 protein [Leptospira ellisii]|uniref:Glycosyltransferase family 39 protein n=1 Tax=Leptospira ellisii TaxID=2023197 RepID=A0AAE4QNL3_9LEPT|nr:glycosyltransferase family 39 protein [Leptospira ellisii]MDV6235664.1 glycosyltransferase family 39 protein [Leptospira ellisii]PKA04995.1 hypothetical protein CH375_07690 [Leptospira ellisii]
MKFKNGKFWLFFLAYFAFLCFGLGSFPLIDWDENIYGAASKNMFLTGDRFRISVNGQLFTEKPPFYFWLASSFYSLFGVGEFATRFPSLLSGLISFAALYFFGKRIVSETFGLTWALIYSSSLLPLLLSRTAYIDHLFNTFIMLSVLCLFLYDRVVENGNSGWKWLILSSCAMGIAVLTKGPLGIAIPAVSFVGTRIAERKIRIPIKDLLLCVFSTLAVVSSYYLTDYLLNGDGFISGFAEFQKKLLTKTLESHSGPWFYHGIVVLLGLFPWTPILFSYIRKLEYSVFNEKSLSSLAKTLLIWSAFVLIVFSAVRTKLPHYSSSIYFPLSFFAAYSVYRDRSRSYLGWVFVYAAGIGIVLFLFPWIVQAVFDSSDFIDTVGSKRDFRISAFDFFPGLALLIGVSAGIHYIKRTRNRKEEVPDALPVLWCGILVWIASLSYTLAPKVVHVLQGGILRLFDAAESQNGKLVYYKYLSFYPMFYRENRIHIIGSYKFKDEENLLVEPGDEALFLIANRNSLVELNFLYPKLNFTPVSNEGNLFLVRAVKK